MQILKDLISIYTAYSAQCSDVVKLIHDVAMLHVRRIMLSIYSRSAKLYIGRSVVWKDSGPESMVSTSQSLSSGRLCSSVGYKVKITMTFTG